MPKRSSYQPWGEFFQAYKVVWLALTTLICNKGSGIAHHVGHLASIVTPSNDKDEIKYNIFQLIWCTF